MIEALVILLCGWANRFAGSGWLVPFPNGQGFVRLDLSGGPAILPAIVYLLACLSLGLPWFVGALLGTAYLLWRILPLWGECLPTRREPPLALIDQTALWTYRQLPLIALLLLPALSCGKSAQLGEIGIQTFVLLIGVVGIYLVAFRALQRADHSWRFSWLEPTFVAEFGAGLAWGGFIVALSAS